MCLIKCCLFIIFLSVLHCNALNCRSDGGPKEEDLKTVYMNCLKRQDRRKSNDSKTYSADQDWNEARGYNQRSQWDSDGRNNRDERSGSNRRFGSDRMEGRDDRISDRGSKMGTREGNDRMGGRDDWMGGRDERTSNRDDRMGRNSRFGNDDNMGDEIMNDRDGVGGRSMMGYHDEEMDKYHLSRREDSGGEYGGMMSRHNDYYTSTQPSRRFRRDRYKEKNSGHRSQYNPNAQKPTEYEDKYHSNERNSSRNSSKDEDAKACALHCLLDHLDMIDEDGMPDRYLVTHAITKDVKNEDLRDFLQESIEECFQIIDNENMDDKCEFSKNLMMCLSEKGRANCDDWKDDLKF